MAGTCMGRMIYKNKDEQIKGLIKVRKDMKKAHMPMDAWLVLYDCCVAIGLNGSEIGQVFGKKYEEVWEYVSNG